MPRFTTHAFCEIAAGTSEAGVAAVSDEATRTSGDDLQIGKMTHLVALHAYGSGLGNARVVSPSLRAKASVYISPLVNDLGDYAKWTKHSMDYRGDIPMVLVTNEQLNAFVTVNQVDADWNNLVGVWLADGPLTPVKGEIWTIYASASGKTFVEKAWTNCELNWTPDLPSGRYQIVGARAYLPNGGLFRFVPRDEPNRPGGICQHDANLAADLVQRKGNMGVWCEFDFYNPPTLDVLPRSVASQSEIYLRVDIIKIG